MSTTQFLEFNAILGLLIIIQFVLLRQSVYHQWNRLYLLLAPILAFSCLSINEGTAEGIRFMVDLPTVHLIPSTAVDTTGHGSSNMLFWIWFIGAGIQFCVLLVKLYMVQKALKSSTGLSCTFLGIMRIDSNLDQETREKVRIHERVHAEQLHSIDILWYESLKILCWFNPMVWLGSRVLKDIHEFIADRKTNELTEDYTETLLASAFGISKIPLANEFNSINLKNRIMMMNKKENTRLRIQWLTVFTLAILSAVTLSCTLEDTEQKKGVYEKVDEMPRFPGCEDQSLKGEELSKCANGKLFAYMGETIKYPEHLEKEGIVGKVLVQFIIDKDGKIGEVEVIESVHKELDAIALNAVKDMPNWSAGIHEGKKVAVSMVLPIVFAL